MKNTFKTSSPVIIDLLDELTDNMTRPKELNRDLQSEVLMEFAASPGSEIGVQENKDNKESIYMTFSNTRGEEPEDFLKNFAMNAHKFFPLLTEYIAELFCYHNKGYAPTSFSYLSDTSHGALLTQESEDIYQIHCTVETFVLL